MDNLADKKYWDDIYAGQKVSDNSRAHMRGEESGNLNNAIKDFGSFLLWNVIFKKYLPKNEKFKILEIGSAPGKQLIKFNKELLYEPYGVELSNAGYQLNVENFKRAGLNVENIINSDFASQSFQKKYAEHFDVVYSRGFIEHFTNPTEVIDSHLALLKQGGFLIVIIPNLRGVNYLLAKLTNRVSFAKHNLEIMDYKKFKDLFNRWNLEQLCCKYFGVFNFGLFNANKRWKEVLLLWLRRFGYFLNFLFFIFKRFDMESKFFSPYLIYIGKKK